MNFELTIPEVDFIAKRLMAGKMDYATAMGVNAILAKLQEQANAKPAPPLEPKNE